tara:strand:+ start:3023 stop:3271 length:249 start_codon:yes stop_codon:yes gene_type:complete
MTTYINEKFFWQDQVRFNKQLIKYFTNILEGKPSRLTRITPEMDYADKIDELEASHKTPNAIIQFLIEENKNLRRQIKNFKE